MLSQGKDALGHATHERHRPERTLLYQLVEKHYPALVEQLELQGKSLPAHVHREFEAYLKCGRLEHGFLRVSMANSHFKQPTEAEIARDSAFPSGSYGDQ
jgi:hypothetical protein